MIDSDLVAKEILPYLQQDVCPVLVEDISEKSDRMIWIVSKAMQEKLNIEGAIVYEEFLEEMVEYSCNMFTCNWDYFYLNNKVNEAKNAETLILGSSYARFGLRKK